MDEACAFSVGVPSPGPVTVTSPTCVLTNFAYTPARQAPDDVPTKSVDQLIRQSSFGLDCGATKARPNPKPFCGATLPVAR